MTLKSACQTRTRLLSSCYLHPTDPVPGICASCLRERLSGLDSLAHPGPSPSAIIITHLANGSGGVRPISSRNKAADPSPELRRCRSVVTTRCEASASFTERARNGSTLAHLFDIDDECVVSNAESKVETKNIISAAAIELTEENGNKNGGENRDFLAALQVANAIDDEDDDVEEGEIKTMKEYIDLELKSKSQKVKDFKELAGNFLGAASQFSKKLQKWGQKQKVNKLCCSNERRISNGEMNCRKGKHLGETQSEVAEYAIGRRSCDTEPRFSVDAGRLSVNDGRISIDEPRASWDGHMIARTIPRLTPMLPVVDNVMLGGGNRFDSHRSSVDGEMHSIMEDETSSGGSGQSNSDSSSSQRLSSFDRSSSVRSFGKKIMGWEGDEIKYVSKAIVSPAKLVITERELKDWHLNSVKDYHLENMEKFGSDPKGATPIENGLNLGSKKSLRWPKVWNVFGLKQKYCERKHENLIGHTVDCLVNDACEKQKRGVVGGLNDTTGLRLMCSSSIVSARRSFEVMGSNYITRNAGNDFECPNKGREEFVLGRNQSAKYTLSNFDSSPSPFYLIPLRSSRRRES